MRKFTRKINNKDFEDYFPWDKRISEYTATFINGSKAFPSLIEKLEKKLEDSPKRKNHLLSAYLIQCTDDLLELKEITYYERSGKFYFYLSQEIKLMQKITVRYENENDPKLSEYKEEVLEIIGLHLEEMHSIASSNEDYPMYSYNDDLSKIEEELVYRINDIFYSTVHYIDLLNYVSRQFETDQQSEEMLDHIPWNGTPGEFGAIMNLLIEGGYISPIRSKANTIRILYDIFEIEADDKPITLNYLKRCFTKDRMRVYYPEKLSIPKSDNYYKNK